MYSHKLTQRQICDLEMILNGGFSPLTGFLNENDYESVINKMRLVSGNLWPIPINLDISDELANKIKIGDTVNLLDSFNHTVSTLTVESIWKPDKNKEAELVFGSPDDICHPSINYLLNKTGNYYIGGSLSNSSDIHHYDFNDLRRTPQELKSYFKQNNITKVVGFQTRNPMHRSHYELTKLAQEESGGHLLVHPVVGMTKPGDVDYFTRVKCYKELIKKYPENTATLSLLPIAMRMGGPREALWHAIIRKNYGCTHFIVGRDHAGPGNNKNNKPFYDPYAAQQLLKQHEAELEITVLTYQMVVYNETLDKYLQINQVSSEDTIKTISGTQLRQLLYSGENIPEWFTFPEIAKILKIRYPPKKNQGFTIFFTGLSGSGKSTIAHALMQKLLELTNKPITILDGDQIRNHLSKGLTFSKEDRCENNRRIGYVSSLITKSGGVAITASIAPYKTIRGECRKQVEQYGGFFEIYISTPLDICEQRDTKGLYKKARSGIIKNFTGISDVFEEPVSPDLAINTNNCSVNDSVNKIIDLISKYI